MNKLTVTENRVIQTNFILITRCLECGKVVRAQDGFTESMKEAPGYCDEHFGPAVEKINAKAKAWRERITKQNAMS